ncbi:MAG: type II toxin-antitoxin system death-on-curing family toxin [Phycisphaerae bacterium]|jgi:death-on-curing protein
MNGPPLFLARHTVLEIHDEQIAEHGGDPGLRDEGLLESALAQPQAQFGGEWLHRDVFEMAAAYVFHLTGNHPFVDGNKRTALGAALLFLAANGHRVIGEGTELADLVLEMIERRRDKSWIAARLRERSLRREV